MANLYTQVKLYCEENGINFDNEISRDNITVFHYDNKPSEVTVWNVDGKTKPTQEQLDSYESQANDLEADDIVRGTRRVAYGDIGEQLDEIFKDIDAWKARIQQIKSDNPKG